MKLLVSVVNKEEALEVLRSGCQCIIDVKNPKEGSLGANFPHVIKEIREIVPRGIEVSATTGDMPNLPGTASLAAFGASMLNVNYVKIGLKNLKTKEDAIYMMKNVVRSVKNYNPSTKVVVAGYADSARIDSLNPLDIPEIAYEAGADVVMIDTAIKDGTKLFDFLKDSELRSFVQRAHKMKLIAAFAGSLGSEDVEKVYKTGADIFGVRGAVCSKKDRLKGKFKSKLVKDLAKQINKIKS